MIRLSNSKLKNRLLLCFSGSEWLSLGDLFRMYESKFSYYGGLGTYDFKKKILGDMCLAGFLECKSEKPTPAFVVSGSEYVVTKYKRTRTLPPLEQEALTKILNSLASVLEFGFHSAESLVRKALVGSGSEVANAAIFLFGASLADPLVSHYCLDHLVVDKRAEFVERRESGVLVEDSYAIKYLSLYSKAQRYADRTHVMEPWWEREVSYQQWDRGPRCPLAREKS